MMVRRPSASEGTTYARLPPPVLHDVMPSLLLRTPDGDLVCIEEGICSEDLAQHVGISARIVLKRAFLATRGRGPPLSKRSPLPWAFVRGLVRESGLSALPLDEDGPVKDS